MAHGGPYDGTQGTLLWPVEHADQGMGFLETLHSVYYCENAGNYLYRRKDSK